MKAILKIFLWALIGFLAIFAVSGVLVARFGKQIIEREATRGLKKKVSIERISLSFPFAIHVNGLKIADDIYAEQVSFYPDLSALLHKTFIIHNLTIRNGKYIFVDQKKVPPQTVIFDRIEASFSRIDLPLESLNTRFKINSVIAGSQYQPLGTADLSGWVDWPKKNMDAALEIKGLEAVYFAPYYGDFISQKKVLSAKVNLSSTFKAQDDDLKIDSHFRLSNLVYAQNQDQNIAQYGFDLVKNALDFFTDKKGNLSLEFSLQTKLDKPNITIEQLKQAILQAAMKNLSSQPPEAIINKVTGTIQQFEDFGKKMKQIFQSR